MDARNVSTDRTRRVDRIPLPGAGAAPRTDGPLPDRRELEALPRSLVRELRSDHAGETGAVFIYRGILAVSRDPAVRAFATEHLATERHHLATFESLLPRRMKTRLGWLCALAGWTTGALPALFGRNAVFATIEAVETFVDEHYQAQIDALDPCKQGRLRALLERFREEEVAHRDDAGQRAGPAPGPFLRAWTRLVGAGSRVGVRIARRL